jgi:hypothetical protein
MDTGSELNLLLNQVANPGGMSIFISHGRAAREGRGGEALNLRDGYRIKSSRGAFPGSAAQACRLISVRIKTL